MRDRSVKTISGDVHADVVRVAPDTVLEFDPLRSTTLTVTGNVVVEGTLRMRPANAEVVHVLHFKDVDESRFVGETGYPVDSDVGMWVIGEGSLDLRGTPRTGWTRQPWSPDWRPGDHVLRAPSDRDDYLTFARHAEGDPVPTVVGLDRTEHRTELCNLTRNVVIEGEPHQRSHVLIASAVPQSIRYTQFRWMGPRRRTAGLPRYHQFSAPSTVLPETEYPPDYFSAQNYANTEPVLSRYPVHFHHCHDGSRGSIVEGCVVRDSSRAFVPHASSGVTFRDCVAFRITDTAYWWDEGEETDDLVWEHCAAFDVRFDPWGHGTPAGFVLGVGQRLVIRDCVAAGVSGGEHAAGFQWPAFANRSEDNVWESSGLVAHNCGGDGIYIWLDDNHRHHVERVLCYRNGGAGIVHGARQNCFHFDDVELFDNVVADLWHQALTRGDVPRAHDQEWRRLRAERMAIRGHPVGSPRAVRFLRARIGHVDVLEDRAGVGTYEIHAELTPRDFTEIVDKSKISVVRRDGSTFSLHRTAS
jgi:hypothetical protein